MAPGNDSNDSFGSPLTPANFRFGAADRLHGSKAFQAVFANKHRKQVGPLVIWYRPNDRARYRLGLSVSRKVGNAVQRNAIKRRLREAFRLARWRWPCQPDALDWVVVVHRHQPLKPVEYQAYFDQAIAQIIRHVRREAP